MEAKSVLDQIQKRATKHGPEVRRVATIEAGEWVRQGDLMLERLPALPMTRGKETKNRQLAIGNTQGSRHVIASNADCTIYAPPDGAGPLVGPLVEARARLLVEHPEHGHMDLPAGVYACTYQRDWARERADEIRRVAD